jgi:hypothetical protein
MALPDTFLLSWYYTGRTRLGLYFNNFGLNQSPVKLNSVTDKGVDSLNGMSASIEEIYRFENIITSHPVEQNSAISDHIIRQPLTITVTGLLSSLVILPVSGFINFSQLGSATETLISLASGKNSNKGITLQTGLLYGKQFAKIDNLAVQSLEIPRNNDYGRASIKFTMVLKQMIITSSKGQLTSSGFTQATPGLADI